MMQLIPDTIDFSKYMDEPPEYKYEQGVLCSLLKHPELLDNALNLKSGHFHSECHRDIFTVLTKMIADGVPIDVITVAERIEAMNLSNSTGGLAYLGEMVSKTHAKTNIARYAEIVINKSIERDLLAAANKIEDTVNSHGDTKDKLFKAQELIMNITENSEPRRPRVMAEILQAHVEILEKRNAGGDKGTSTGMEQVDEMLNGGLRDGNLIVVAGRPGMGKTAFSVQLGLNVAMSGKPVFVSSMEMSAEEIMDRTVANIGNVDLKHVIDGDMSSESGDRISFAYSKIQDMPMVIDDQGGLTLHQIASKARSVKRKHGLGLVIIDYIQLMSGDKDNREQEISAISRGLKSLAKELQVPVIALSQLSRKCEERTNKRPIPSDLRESGAIEQDADVIVLLYRDDQYDEQSPNKGVAEVIIAKNRQGKTGTAYMTYIGDKTKFADLHPDFRPVERETKKNTRGFQL